MPDDEAYVVVRNHEDQYSIWWADRPVPTGWETIGEPSSKDACLARVEDLWTDMRPRTVRRWMGERAAAD
jgi:MbtH protein